MSERKITRGEVEATRELSRCFRLVCNHPDRFQAGREFVGQRFSPAGVRQATEREIKEAESAETPDEGRVQYLRSQLDESERDHVRVMSILDWIREQGVGLNDIEAQATLLIATWFYDHEAASNAALPKLLREIRSYPVMFDVIPGLAVSFGRAASTAMFRLSASGAAVRTKLPGGKKPRGLHGGHEVVGEFLIWAATVHRGVTTNKDLYALWSRWPQAKSHKRPAFESLKRYRTTLKGTKSSNVPTKSEG